MEALGQLAGGIAHDFNNVLALIMLAADDAEDSEEIAVIRDAARRGAELIRKMLIFSRHQIMESESLDLNEVVRESMRLLPRLLGEHIVIDVQLCLRPLPVKIDRSQIDVALMNLAVNARDAMPSGGTLTVRTESAEFDVAGDERRHAVISVADTGCGMSKEVQKRIFEPFYTTKGPGKGTGLGLSMVFGIVKQSGGEVTVESKPDRGSSFRLWFPITGEAPAAVRPVEVAVALGRGHGHILVVEDQPELRRMTCSLLRESGYVAFEAADGLEALSFLGGHDGPVDLVLTDVLMPKLTGPEFMKRLLALGGRHSRCKVLFVSGGPMSEHLIRAGIAGPHFCVSKPYSRDELLAKVAEILR